jgi:hypothetical protein
MTIKEDIQYLENHVKSFSDAYRTNDSRSLREAFFRVKASHEDGERVAAIAEPIINGFAAILQSYNVVRQFPEKDND